MMNSDHLDMRLTAIEEVRQASVLHRWELLRLHPDADVRVGITASFLEENRPGETVLRVTATYAAMRGDLLRPLLRSCIDARFEVTDPDVRPVVQTDLAVYLPDSLLRMMLGVAIGALRGVVALRTMGTPLAGRPLPLICLDDILAKMQATRTHSRSKAFFE